MVYVGFLMPKVKVPASFSGTEGFPARRDARYTPGIIIPPRHFYGDYKLLCLIGLFQAILYNLTTSLAVLQL
jgi:hypothetical protein